MKTLLVNCANETDATSLYRGMGPLSHLKRKHGEFDIMQVQHHSWATMAFADAVFLQRPTTKQHRGLAELARLSNKPLWVDYDDLIFQLPDSNPSAEYFSKPDVQRNVAEMIAMAQVVTVSTRLIAEQFDPLRKKAGREPCRVIQNGLNRQMFPRHAEQGMSRNPVVLWRGSATHDADVASQVHGIRRLVEQNPTFVFTFIGSPGWMLKDMLRGKKNVEYGKPMDPMEYFEAIRVLRPTLMLVPLQNNPFNQAKSNIAWIEATYAGAVTLTPSMPEWQDISCVRYHDNQSFIDEAQNVLNGLNRKTGELEGSASLVQASAMNELERFDLDQINQQRRSLLNEMWGPF